MAIFGTNDEKLIEGLEAMRRSRCAAAYGPDAPVCDCKYGFTYEGRNTSEQTGCPELRQAIMLLQGKFQEIHQMERELDNSAANTLRRIERVIADSKRG